MARPKGLPKTGGRKKGQQNKSTVIAKEAIAQVADNLGGVNRLTAWAQSDPDNEKAFWVSIYPKLLPLQVSGEGGGAVQIGFKTVYESKDGN
jgi:hypothetical protein